MTLEQLLINLETKLDAKSAREFRNMFNAIRLSILDAAEKAGEFSYFALKKYSRLEKLMMSIADEVYTFFKFQKKLIDAGTADMFINTYIFQLHNLMAQGISFDFLPTYSTEFKTLLINGIRTELYNSTIDPLGNRDILVKKIYENLLIDLKNGKSVEWAAKQIKEAVNIQTWQAARTARTELHEAMNQGQLTAFNIAKKAGVVFTKYWLSALQDNTRLSHAAMNNVAADKTGYFTLVAGPNKGKRALMPGMFSIAGEDINCRCTTYAKLDKYPNTLQDQKNLDISLEKWREKYNEIRISELTDKI